MAAIFDNIHYSFRKIDSYNKAFNIVIAPREIGKTATMWYQKIYCQWKKNHKAWIYCVRNSTEISDELINSIFEVNIRKFTDDDFTISYLKTSFDKGLCDVYIGLPRMEKIIDKDGTEREEKVYDPYLFFRIVSLNIKLRKIKLAVLPNIAGCLFDEYIIDPRTQERYLPKEAFKIKEAYTTWRREADGVLKFYFLGNPYSLYNPLFLDLNVDTTKLRKGEMFVGDTYIIDYCPPLHPELLTFLLERNPFFKYDEGYTDFALYGSAVNDSSIRLGKLPQKYHLNFVFKTEGKLLAIYRNRDYLSSDKYFVKFIESVSARRVVYCYDFAELVDRSIVISISERKELTRFKESFRKREVIFDNVACYYMCEEIYKNI